MGGIITGLPTMSGVLDVVAARKHIPTRITSDMKVMPGRISFFWRIFSVARF